MQIPLPLLILATLALFGLLVYAIWEAFSPMFNGRLGRKAGASASDPAARAMAQPAADAPSAPSGGPIDSNVAAEPAAESQAGHGEPVAAVGQRRISPEEAERFLAGLDTIETFTNPNGVATKLVRIGRLSGAAFAAQIDSLVERKLVHPDWRIIRLDMDLVGMDGSWRDPAEADCSHRPEDGCHPDVEGAIARLDEAFDDEYEGVVDNAADIVAIMIESGFLDDEFRTRMRAGLERARDRFGKRLSGLDRLETALEGEERRQS